MADLVYVYFFTAFINNLPVFMNVAPVCSVVLSSSMSAGTLHPCKYLIIVTF